MATHPLRICVALRPGTNGEPGPRPVLLRSTADARLLLGAQLDATDTIREWLEIWVQTVAGIEQSPVAQREHVSNQLLDDKWRATADGWRESDGAAFLATGWEKSPRRPAFFDPSTGKVVHPIDPASGESLRLCTNEPELKTAGLPGYAASLHRYWSGETRTRGGASFFPATAGASENAAVKPRREVIPDSWVPLNPEGGLLMVRRHAPLALEDYVDLLNDKPWRGILSGPSTVRPGGAYEALADLDGRLHAGEHFLLGGRGRVGRFIESFHLRLRLVYDALKVVRDAVARRQLPLLNVSTDSLRVELSASAASLPLLWAARVVLSSPGQAVALPIKSSDLRHFLSLEPAATSIFRPESIGTPVRGQGNVRLRRVTTDAAGQTSTEGTLVTSERLGHSASDLVWLKLPLNTGTTDLFAHVDAAEGLAQGEMRFRSIPQTLDPARGRALHEAEGNAFAATAFETIPMLSTPCDLYALGVIALRILLLNRRNSLSIALDETLSFGRQLGREAAGEGDLVARALRLVESDSRWSASLGAHRLSEEELAPEEVSAWLPDALWWRTIATIARFFPGQGTDSYCRDFGDVSNFAPERVFERPLADLDHLLICSRGLLFSDWNANREVASIIQRVR